MNHPTQQEHDEDAAIDRVLAGLGKARLDDDFTQRITHGVELRRRDATAKRPLWMWTLGFASAVAVVVAATVMAHRPRAPYPQLSEAVTSLPAAAALPVALEASDPEPKAVRSHPSPRVAVAEKPKAVPDPAENASFPAPPAPLTEQERLLRRIAHTGDRMELAMLNPEIRDSLLEQDRKQVDGFFYQPPRVDDKGNMIDAQGKLLAVADKGDSQ